MKGFNKNFQQFQLHSYVATDKEFLQLIDVTEKQTVMMEATNTDVVRTFFVWGFFFP